MNAAGKIGTTVLGAGFTFGMFGWWLSNQIDYEPISIKVDTISKEAISFRVVFEVNNPTRYNVQVSKQFYRIYIAGHMISTANENQAFRILNRGVSTLMVNLTIKYSDIEKNIPAFQGVNLSLLNNLQVAVYGRLSAKIGFMPIVPLPVRSNFTMGDLF